MLYIVCNSCQPNTAPMNRVLSFIRGFSDLKVEAEVVFLAPDSHQSVIHDEYPYIRFRYMWKGMRCGNRILNKLIEEYNACRFARLLKPDDVVFLTNFGNVFFRVLGRKGVSVIHEKTEHPDIYKFWGFNIQRYKRLVSKVDGMLVISTQLKEYYMSLGVPEDKVKVINMIVDHNRFKNIAKQGSETYIAYCGTASNNKDGVDDLIKSFAIVHRSHPNVKLYIIGKTPDKEDESGNIRLIDSLGIKDSVVFTGVISSEKMPQVLKNATVLALNRPDSLQAQCGFPTKLGEYLLTENPTVVTSVGDIPLFLKDGESALISRPSNPEEFASKLIWAIEHPEAAADIGRAGACVARTAFNYLSETKKIIDTIKSAHRNY